MLKEAVFAGRKSRLNYLSSWASNAIDMWKPCKRSCPHTQGIFQNQRGFQPFPAMLQRPAHLRLQEYLISRLERHTLFGRRCRLHTRHAVSQESRTSNGQQLRPHLQASSLELQFMEQTLKSQECVMTRELSWRSLIPQNEEIPFHTISCPFTGKILAM